MKLTAAASASLHALIEAQHPTAMTKIERKAIKELRCLKCGSLLGRQVDSSTNGGNVEIKCGRCRTLNLFKLTWHAPIIVYN